MRAFTADGRGRSLRWVDLGNGAVHKAPAPQRGLSVRFTGDPSVSADGEWLVAPGLLVDNETPERPDSLGVSMYYVDVGKWNPSLLVWPLHPGGRPGERPEAILTIANDPSGGRVGSYPSAALFDPDSAVAYAVMESSDLVVSVPMSWRGKDLEPRSLQFAPRAAAFTAAGPRGLAIVGDTVVLDVALDHGLQGVRRDGLAPDPSEWSGSEGRFTRSATPWTFASPTLDPEAEAGRRLFMSATDDEIVMPGSGVSCSTCHLEGRDDALTWPLGPGDRQTPSLRGGLADTAPYTSTTLWSSCRSCRSPNPSRNTPVPLQAWSLSHVSIDNTILGLEGRVARCLPRLSRAARPARRRVWRTGRPRAGARAPRSSTATRRTGCGGSPRRLGGSRRRRS